MAGGMWSKARETWNAIYAIPALDDMADELGATAADLQASQEREAKAWGVAEHYKRLYEDACVTIRAHADEVERLQAQLAELTAPHNGHRPEVRTWQETKREMVP